jgi:hypothetical protein
VYLHVTQNKAGNLSLDSRAFKNLTPDANQQVLTNSNWLRQLQLFKTPADQIVCISTDIKAAAGLRMLPEDTLESTEI